MSHTSTQSKDKHFDISRVPSHGFLILPLSMPKLCGDQSPKEIYKFLKFFDPKVKVISIDVIILYTNGLYFNTANGESLGFRQKSNSQILNHSRELKSMILKEREYIPQAFHFLPWDYVLLNAPQYDEFKNKLLSHYRSDEQYRALIHEDLNGREVNPANVNFIAEELAINHILRQKYVDLPSYLSKPDGWRLICYPGPTLKSDIATVQQSLLKNNPDFSGQDHFSRSFYDWKNQVIMDFDRMESVIKNRAVG
ncbi:MAG: hypothetical protein AAF203_00130 [Pseudomonadota bacterium]